MLKDRNILLVVVARFVSRLGGTAAFFIGVWGTAAYTFEATPTQFAWMAGGASVAAIIGSLVAGALIDRFGPRRVLIVAEILTIPAVVALMLADTFVAFALFNACFALVGVPTFTAGASFAPYLVHERVQLEKVNALIEGVGSLAFILGPAVGAAVASVWEPRAVFVVMAIASVIAIAFAYFIRIDETRRSSEGSSAWRELTEGLRVSYATPSLRYYILTGTAIWFGFGAFAALEPLFYRDAVGVGVEWIGYMNTLFGVGLVAGAATLPRLPQKVVSARGLAIMTTLVGLGTVLYVGSTNLWLIAAGATVWGFLVGATEPLLRTLIHLDSPHEYVGRIMGTAQYHRNAGELVPLAVAPGLAAIFGVQSVLIGGGVLVAVAAVSGFGVARRIDAEAIAHPEAPLFATATEEPAVLPAG